MHTETLYSNDRNSSSGWCSARPSSSSWSKASSRRACCARSRAPERRRQLVETNETPHAPRSSHTLATHTQHHCTRMIPCPETPSNTGWARLIWCPQRLIAAAPGELLLSHVAVAMATNLRSGQLVLCVCHADQVKVVGIFPPGTQFNEGTKTCICAWA